MYYYIYNKTDCLKFIQLVKNHLIVKYNQAIAFEMFLQTNDIKIKKQMYSICNEEKHNIEIFNDLNQTSNGKDGYLETLRLRNIKEKFCKEIQIKQVYKEKSEKTFIEVSGERYSIPGDMAKYEKDGQMTLLGRGSVSINSGGDPRTILRSLMASPIHPFSTMKSAAGLLGY